jgi:N-acetylglucosamine-6-sulfatase
MSKGAMLRRAGTVLACAGLLATMLASCADKSRNDAAPVRRPNIVFVLMDDLDNTTMQFWDAMPKSRRLIADRGLEFTENFAPAPVCCPARAAILTGKYPHNNGIFDGSAPDGGYDTFATNGQENDTLATRLQTAGYTTSFVGKYVNGYENNFKAIPPGWDDFFALVGDGFADGYDFEATDNGEVVSFGNDPDDYQTDVLARRGREFIASSEERDDTPFLLFMAPTAPHDPLPPARRDADNEWSRAEQPRRANFNEADVSDKPTWLRLGVPEQSEKGIASLTKRYRDKMGSLLAADDMIASLVRELRDRGELDNTVLMFGSDNGNNLGAHRLPHKQVPYEESIRVPFAVAGPGVRKGVEESIVSHLDYAPTMMDLAGIDRPDSLDGRSLVPLLREKGPPLHDDVLIEEAGTYSPFYSVDTLGDVRYFTDSGTNLLGPPTFRAVRDEDWLYVQWYSGDEHEYELYDLHEDPFQEENVLATDSGRQAKAEVVERLQARLDALATCAGANCG